MVAFRCYSPSGSDAHEDAWRAALPPEFNSEVDVALEVLQRHRTLDDERYFKALRGSCQGLTEIRIDFELEPDDPRSQAEKTKPRKGKRRQKPKIVIRILGFGTAENFVLLYGFRKRGDSEYGPACRSARNRQEGVNRDERRAIPCRFP
jgi:hypothetical protein